MKFVRDEGNIQCIEECLLTSLCEDEVNNKVTSRMKCCTAMGENYQGGHIYPESFPNFLKILHKSFSIITMFTLAYPVFLRKIFERSRFNLWEFCNFNILWNFK